MKHKPVEVVQIVSEKFDLTSGKSVSVKSCFVAMWKAEKRDCQHEHSTRRAAGRCVPRLEEYRRRTLDLRRVLRQIGS